MQERQAMRTSLFDRLSCLADPSSTADDLLRLLAAVVGEDTEDILLPVVDPTQRDGHRFLNHESFDD